MVHLLYECVLYLKEEEKNEANFIHHTESCTQDRCIYASQMYNEHAQSLGVRNQSEKTFSERHFQHWGVGTVLKGALTVL